MNFGRLSHLVHTLRYVRPVQIANRLQRKLLKPQPSTEPAPPRRVISGDWTPASQRPACLTTANQLRVFQHAIDLDSPNVWNDQSLAHLVRYNLHYFDDLNAANASQRTLWHRDLITRWVGENPPAEGTGWEPYPISLRIVNWIKWCLAGNELAPLALNSLATQARSLRSQLEYHLLANHLFANAKALVFAGAFFSGEEADAWLKQGVQILRSEITEQILSDGGHFELSPMYHSVILEDLLDLINLANTFAAEPKLDWMKSPAETTRKMRLWLQAMCHPDGQISFFNDAAQEIASAPNQLEHYAQRLGLPSVNLPSSRLIQLSESGYVRVQFEDHVAILDVARVGPSYQPGHAHADTLSFEWSLNGARVLVNSGTSCYGISDERERQRGTAAHNTVEIDGEDSSEVWSGFRVARRAIPHDLEIDESTEGITIACSHSGYRRLPGKVTHRRSWNLRAGGLSVADELSGRCKTAIARFHVHPDWDVTTGSDGLFQATTTGTRRVQFRTDATGTLETTTYHPAFEISLPMSVIEARFPGPKQMTSITWSV